jgi:hypothetical protein
MGRRGAAEVKAGTDACCTGTEVRWTVGEVCTIAGRDLLRITAARGRTGIEDAVSEATVPALSDT